MSSDSLFFEPFELQPAQRRLLRNGKPVGLRARAFDLLLVLARRNGDLVTKGELLDLVWPGVVVEENNIAVQIAALRRVLGGDVIATVPGHGYRFTATVREGGAGAVPVAAIAGSPPGAVPVVASGVAPAPAVPLLFGRAEDARCLAQSLLAGRCVTLVGAAGVGKTSLAKMVAAGRPAASVAWVDLAALGDGAQLAGAICRALGVASPAASADADAAIAGALAGGEWLLVLDNAEHLVDAVAQTVQSLLAARPTSALLVTSQLPLRIAGECVQPLEPLALPAEDPHGNDDALDSPAVQMLLERVRAADPRFPLTDAALPLLRRLCARLDGLPLALEMAAAMVPLLGLEGVLSALDQRFAALRRGSRGAPARHKTLRAAMAWSHGLLQPVEQRVFRRLGVFAGAFSLDLALAVLANGDGQGEGVGEDRWALIDAFSQLVDRSLVASLHADPPQYRLLETLASFAAEELEAAGETQAMRARAVQQLTVHLRAIMPSPHRNALATVDLVNVPDLLAWALQHAPAAAIELVLAASKVATWTRWLGEAGNWVADCEPVVGEPIPLPLQAEWWRVMAKHQSFDRGQRTLEAAARACEIERQLGNPSGLFWSLIPMLRSRLLGVDEFEARRAEAQALLDVHPDWQGLERITFSGSLGLEYLRRGDFAAALLHLGEEADLADQAGKSQIAENARSNVVSTLVGLGRHQEALELITTMLARSDGTPSAIGAHSRLQLLRALMGLGRLDDAVARAAEALQWCRRHSVSGVFQVLAQLAGERGRADLAAVLLGHYKQALAAHGAEMPAEAHSPWQRAMRMATETLDAATLRGLMQRGAQMDAAGIDRVLLDLVG